ncbi:MAG: putative lipid II flippase FtsW [Patulibacter sp.]|nr:putative lipid II flippase FtsW [Patulibacter sp.]
MKRSGRPPELRREYERLLGVVLILVVLGAIWVYSASSSEQIIQGGGSGTNFLIRYVLFAAVGFGVLALMSRVGVAVVRKLTVPLLIASIVLSFAVILPGLGKEVNGATRWIGAGAIVFQPSELAKTALVAFLALRLSMRRRPMRQLGDIGPELGAIAVLVAIVGGIQSDLGTAVVIAGAGLCVLVVAGMPRKFFVPLGAVTALGLLVMIVMAPYRMARLTSFLSPWADASGTGYQVTQGQLAIGSGGFTGNGLGSSIQKADWLPEAHTDFILAVVGEELGAVGIIMLLVLYGLIAFTGLRIADQCRDQYQKLLATGITAIIICQAMLNVWVVLGIFPLTGVPLPFISYGSTNLIVLLAGVGVLLNIARGVPAFASAPLVDLDPVPPGRGPGGRAPITEDDVWRAPSERRPARETQRRPRPVGRPGRVDRPIPVMDADELDVVAYRGAAGVRARDARRPRDASRFAGDAADVRDRSGWDSGARGPRVERRRRAS